MEEYPLNQQDDAVNKDENSWKIIPAIFGPAYIKDVEYPGLTKSMIVEMILDDTYDTTIKKFYVPAKMEMSNALNHLYSLDDKKNKNKNELFTICEITKLFCQSILQKNKFWHSIYNTGDIQFHVKQFNILSMEMYEELIVIRQLWDNLNDDDAIKWLNNVTSNILWQDNLIEFHNCIETCSKIMKSIQL